MSAVAPGVEVEHPALHFTRAEDDRGPRDPVVGVAVDAVAIADAVLVPVRNGQAVVPGHRREPQAHGVRIRVPYLDRERHPPAVPRDGRSGGIDPRTQFDIFGTHNQSGAVHLRQGATVLHAGVPAVDNARAARPEVFRRMPRRREQRVEHLVANQGCCSNEQSRNDDAVACTIVEPAPVAAEEAGGVGDVVPANARKIAGQSRTPLREPPPQRVLGQRGHRHGAIGERGLRGEQGAPQREEHDNSYGAPEQPVHCSRGTTITTAMGCQGSPLARSTVVATSRFHSRSARPVAGKGSDEC